MLKSLSSHLLLVVAIAQAAGAEGYEERLLDSFEGGAAGWSGGGIAGDGATHGRQAYRARYGKGGSEIRWSGTLDVSGWQKLKLDTANDGEAFIVSIIFRDADGREYRSWQQRIGPGRGRLEYNLRGLVSQVPDERGRVVALDPTRIVGLHLATDDIGGGVRNVTIDNLRLARGPEPALDLDEFRPPSSGRVPEAVPGNLIANGDFEMALSNWGMWGQWDGGEYRFSVVDGEGAHTGSQAARIVCQKQGRGGIIANFTAPAAGRYRLRFAYRGDGAATMKYEFEGRGIGETLAVGAEWRIHEREIELPQGRNDLYIYHVSAGTLSIDSVSVAPAGAAPAGEAGRRGDGAANGKGTKVVIAGDRTGVNGRPFFPIAFFGVRDPAHLEGSGANMAEMRIDAGDLFIGHGTRAEIRQALDALAEKGLLGTVAFTGLLRGHRPDLVLDIARGLEDHPALFGWYLCDEPDHGRFNVPPHMVRTARRILNGWDGDHPTIAGVMAWNRSIYFQYADASDILASFVYTVDDTAWVVRAARLLCEGTEAPRPVWMALKSDDPCPSEEQVRVQAYAAIANGVDGLFWFELEGSRKAQPERLRGVFRVTSELAAIHDVLAAPDAAAQPTSSTPQVHVLLKDAPQGPVLIAVNTATSDAGEVRIALPSGLRTRRADVRFEDRELRVRDGALVDRFGGNQRHVYELRR